MNIHYAPTTTTTKNDDTYVCVLGASCCPLEQKNYIFRPEWPYIHYAVVSGRNELRWAQHQSRCVLGKRECHALDAHVHSLRVHRKLGGKLKKGRVGE